MQGLILRLVNLFERYHPVGRIIKLNCNCACRVGYFFGKVFAGKSSYPRVSETHHQMQFPSLWLWQNFLVIILFTDCTFFRRESAPHTIHHDCHQGGARADSHSFRKDMTRPSQKCMTEKWIQHPRLASHWLEESGFFQGVRIVTRCVYNAPKKQRNATFSHNFFCRTCVLVMSLEPRARARELFFVILTADAKSPGVSAKADLAKLPADGRICHRENSRMDLFEAE